MLATLSRWRSRVQIPPGTLNGTVRKPAKRRSSNLRDSVGSTPTRATGVVLLTAACKPVVAKQVRWTTRGSIPPQPTQRDFRFEMSDLRFEIEIAEMARSSIGKGYWPFKPERWVRLPYGLLWSAATCRRFGFRGCEIEPVSPTTVEGKRKRRQVAALQGRPVRLSV